MDTEEIPLAVRPAEGVDAVAVEVEEVSKKKKKKKRSAEEAIATEEASAEPMDIGKSKSNASLEAERRVKESVWRGKCIAESLGKPNLTCLKNPKELHQVVHKSQ